MTDSTSGTDEKAARKAEKQAARETARRERREKTDARRARAAERMAAASATLAELQMNGSFGGATLTGGTLRKGFDVHPVAGATAAFESGADAKRMTATRVVGGAILAGPAGAIVGGLAKKNQSRCYVTIALADGQTLLLDENVKEERKAREFVAKVNAASAHYAAQA